MLFMTLALMGIASGNVRAAVDVFNNSDKTGVCSGDPATKPDFCKDTTVNENPITGPNGIMTKIIQVLAILVGITAVIMLIISGIRLSASGGDPQAVKAARTGVIYSLVGIAVAVAAQAIVTFVIGKA